MNSQANTNDNQITEMTVEEQEAKSGAGPLGYAASQLALLGVIATVNYVFNCLKDPKCGRPHPNLYDEHGSFPGGGGGSDIRIKRDIKVVGHNDKLGVDVYSWKYAGADNTRYVGVMAQDLQAKPELEDAVSVATAGQYEGFLQVDYAALNMAMATEATFNQQGMSAVTR